MAVVVSFDLRDCGFIAVEEQPFMFYFAVFLRDLFDNDPDSELQLF